MYRTLRKRPLLAIGLVILGGISVFTYPEKTIAETQNCLVNECKQEIMLSDNGKTFTYKIGRKFNVVLDKGIYPVDNLNCDKSDAKSIEKTVSVLDLYPNQMQRFVAKQDGVCKLTNGTFSVTIVVPPKVK